MGWKRFPPNTPHNLPLQAPNPRTAYAKANPLTSEDSRSMQMIQDQIIFRLPPLLLEFLEGLLYGA